MLNSPADLKVGRALGDAIRLLLRTWRPTLRYSVATGLIVTIAFAPLLLAAVYGAFKLTGAGAAVNFGILDLALSLRGVLLFLVWAIAASLVVTLLMGGPVLYTAAARVERQTTWRTVAGRVLRGWTRVPGVGALQFAVLSMILGPLVAATTAALVGLALLPFGIDFGHIAMPAGLLSASVFYGALLVLAALGFFFYVRWVFSVHVFLLDRCSLRKAIGQSTRLVKGHRWAVARLLLAHHLSQALLLAVVSLLAGGLAWLLLGVIFGPESPLYVAVAALVLVIYGAAAGLVGVVDLGRLAALQTNLYAILHPDGEAALETAGEPLRVSSAATRPWRRWKIVALFLLALGVSTAFTVPSVLEEWTRAEEASTLVTAHRGSSGEAPQNTMAAILLAIKDGADYAEIDILQAKDGALVVIHDINLSHLAGVNLNVFDLTLEELKEHDVGSHFDPRFANERIPTLEEVIVAAKGKIKLNIELKTHGHEAGFVASVVELIRRLEFGEECVITSLDLPALEKTRSLAPELRIGAIIAKVVGRTSALDVDFYSVQPTIATTSFIRRAHRRGREVHIWTLNSPEDVKRFVDRGVDNVITDFPRMVQEVIDARTPEDELRAAFLRLFNP